MGFCFYLRVPKHFSVLPMIRSVNDTEQPAYEKKIRFRRTAQNRRRGTQGSDLFGDRS
jgi:hypothetical protein